MRPVVIGAVTLTLLLTAAVGWMVWRDAPVASGASGAAANIARVLDSAAVAPSDQRVRVSVLNATNRSGLARRATQQLRDYGYDVVHYGNAGDTTLPTTVEVPSRDEALGDRVVRALGAGTVRLVDGELAYLDVRVTVGRDWDPSPESFRP